MNRISTHVLDIALGRPAADVPVRLERQNASGWQELTSARTDQDGRCPQLLPERAVLVPGIYRLNFDTASYFSARKVEGLYPLVEITFSIRDNEQSFHIPLLLSPNGYSTYRGS